MVIVIYGSVYGLVKLVLIPAIAGYFSKEIHTAWMHYYHVVLYLLDSVNNAVLAFSRSPYPATSTE